jgi:hypothetical protein
VPGCGASECGSTPPSCVVHKKFRHPRKPRRGNHQARHNAHQSSHLLITRTSFPQVRH